MALTRALCLRYQSLGASLAQSQLVLCQAIPALSRGKCGLQLRVHQRCMLSMTRHKACMERHSRRTAWRTHWQLKPLAAEASLSMSLLRQTSQLLW